MEKIDKIVVKNINKKFENKVVFDDFEIELDLNKVNCIVGKSGCGKSTLLNILSGVLKNDTDNFNSLEKYGLSYIFQEDRLVEWLTVEENINLIAKKCYSKDELQKSCDKYLDLVGIKEYKNYYPQKLSGGLRQRVNIARAFIYPSNIIIMDEPFKSIDIVNKEIIMDNFKRILEGENRTVIFVTHDIDEAIALADKIFVLGDSPVKVRKVFEQVSSDVKKKIYDLI